MLVMNTFAIKTRLTFQNSSFAVGPAADVEIARSLEMDRMLSMTGLRSAAMSIVVQSMRPSAAKHLVGDLVN